MRQLFGHVSRWLASSTGETTARESSATTSITLDDQKFALEMLVATLPPATAGIMTTRLRSLKSKHDLVSFTAQLYTTLSRLYGETDARIMLNAALAGKPGKPAPAPPSEPINHAPE